MKKRVVLSGYFGFDNFGDEKVLSIIIETLKAQDAQITVFSRNPKKTGAMYGVHCINSFNLPAILKEILFCDVLVSGGGSLLQDATSIQSLFYYLGVIFWGLVFGKKVVLYSQGIGPIRSKSGWLLTKILLKKASLICVRDIESYNKLQKAGVESNLCADALWSKDFEEVEKKNRVIIQLRSWHGITKDKIQSMADVIAAQFPDLEIKILPLQMSADLNICRKMQQELKLRGVEADLYLNLSNDEIIRVISESKFVIAMRYHACLCAIKSGCRVLAIAYDIKVENIANQANIPLLPIDLLKRGFSNALENMKAYSLQESSFFCLKEVTKSRQNNELLCKILSEDK